jgi:hypothetical protein
MSCSSNEVEIFAEIEDRTAKSKSVWFRPRASARAERVINERARFDSEAVEKSRVK